MHTCELVCLKQRILETADVADALSPAAALDAAAAFCDTIERDITRWQCNGIADTYVADLLHGHCNTACKGQEDQRQRRSTCRSHNECSTTQFCSQTQECEPCSVCAMDGFDVALGGYCPCLGGTIEGTTPAEGATVVGGTLQPIVFTTKNVGPAVHIELYIRVRVQSRISFSAPA